VGIVAVERRQVHQRDCAQEPGSLIVGLDGAALRHGLHAAFQRASVDVAHGLQPARIERHARIALDMVRPFDRRDACR
jgi:hypothetical protein